MKLIDLAGQQFGYWTVLGRHDSLRGMTRYLCRCKCGTQSVVFAKHLRSSSSRGCHPCSVKQGARHPQWQGVGDISAGWWRSHVARCVTRHARKPIKLAITIAEAWGLFLQQNRRCALSGVSLEFDGVNGTSASLDRIDSNGDYALGNVQWVHKHVNLMKNRLPQKEFIEICRQIAKTIPSS